MKLAGAALVSLSFLGAGSWGASAQERAAMPARNLHVIVAADDGKYSDEEVRRRIDELSESMSDSLGITLSVESIIPWNSREGLAPPPAEPAVPPAEESSHILRSLNALYKRLVAEGQTFDHLIGFAQNPGRLPTPTKKQPVMIEGGGKAYFLYPVALIVDFRELRDPCLRLTALMHEVLHNYGAPHSSSSSSLDAMLCHGIKRFDQEPKTVTCERPHKLEKSVREIVELTKTFDLRRGTSGISEASQEKLLAIYERVLLPGDPNPLAGAHYNEGLDAYDASRHAEAYRRFSSAAAIQPDLPHARENRLIALKAWVESEPDNAWAAEELTRLEALRAEVVP